MDIWRENHSALMSIDVADFHLFSRSKKEGIWSVLVFEKVFRNNHHHVERAWIDTFVCV